jgi:hypothetical protein
LNSLSSEIADSVDSLSRATVIISGEQGNGLNFSKEFTSGEGTKAAIAIADAKAVADEATMKNFGFLTLLRPEAIATDSSRLELTCN